MACCCVSIDIIGFALLACCNGGNHRNEPSLNEGIDDANIYLAWSSHIPQIHNFFLWHCQFVCVTFAFLATKRLPSLPLMPTALPPALWMSETIFLLILPARTISNHFGRFFHPSLAIPLENFVLMPSRSNILAIWGPPPCTITGYIPLCFRKTTSFAMILTKPHCPSRYHHI